MIDRRIVKFKLRRGLEEQRRTVVFEEGELVYITDTKKIYVGDGRLSGGSLVANGVYGLSGFPSTATANDLLYRYDYGKMYISDGSRWEFTGPYPDESTLTFNGTRLGVSLSGIQYTHLHPNVAATNGGLALSSTGLRVDFDTSTLTIDSGKLKVLPGAGTVTLDPDGGIVSSLNGLAINADGATVDVYSSGMGNMLYVKQISAAQLATSAVEITNLNSNVVQGNGGLKITVNGVAVDYDPTTLSIIGGKLTVNSVGVLPAGTILATAAISAAPGFLPANGSIVSIADYPALYAAIGTTFNSGTVPASGFMLPDLRGYFVRGYGTNTDGTASGSRAAKQSDNTRSHAHTYTNGAPVRVSSGDQTIQVRLYNAGETTSTSYTTGDETRPANIPLLHVIKT